MLDVEKLVVLRAVAAAGSIAAAARELQYTRSAISQQMSALERAAGTPLLVRSGNRVTLTPMGRRLLEHTERILVELRAAEAALHQGDSEVAGHLKIGVPFREGPAVMSSALTWVRQRYPGLEITLAATTDEKGADEVRHGRLDLAILSQFGPEAAASEPGLRQWTLGHDPLRLCVPGGHRLAEAPSCSIADLHDESWVMNTTGSLGRLTLGLCSVAGFRPTIVATVDDVATAVRLVSVGWGVTIAPELTPVEPEAAVKRIPLDGVTAFRHTILLARDGEQDSPQIATVVSAVLVASSNFAYL
jgi:DNA-binding transcriptional LysR family regulator